MLTQKNYIFPVALVFVHVSLRGSVVKKTKESFQRSQKRILLQGCPPVL